MQPIPSALVGAGVGAIFAIVLDPVSGRRRRALMQEKVLRVARRGSRTASKAGRDVAHRAKGVLAAARHVGPESAVDDAVLVERVRATMGHFASHPQAISVVAHRGTIVLEGQILAGEVDQVIDAIEGVPGVSRVENRLDTRETRGKTRQESRQRRWFPSVGAIAAVGGAGLAAILLGRAVLDADRIAGIGMSPE
jgi:hypothetical protein